MSALGLLARLKELNIRVWADGERLRYSAPKDVLTEDLRHELAAHKSELILLLSASSPSTKPAVPLAPVNRDQPLPLSFAQQRLWFLDQMVPGNSSYNICSALQLANIDVHVLQQTLAELVRRHESFRTLFVQLDDGQPAQKILAATDVALPVVDLQTVPVAYRWAEVERLTREEFKRPFDLARGPLLRTQLLQIAPAEYVFLATMHHIVSDGWSMDIFFRELTGIYAAFALGQPSPLPPLPIQYADFAIWQRGWLSGSILEEQIAYWRQQLADLPVLKLPMAQRRPLLPTFRGNYSRVTLPPALSPHLESLGRREGCTLFMVLIAAFYALLHRYTAQTDIVVGIPVAGRDRVEVEGIIGFFVNTLVMRVRLDSSLSFVDLLHRVREVALGAYAHQDLPFEKLVEELQPERDVSRNPLCQVTFQLWHANQQAGPAGETDQRPLNVATETSIFDLAFRLWQTPQGIAGGIEYSTDLFDAETIQRLIDHYLNILDHVAVSPDTAIAELPLLAADERQLLLVEWNMTAVEFDVGGCLHHLFEAQVARSPDRTAVVFGDQHVSYKDLDRQANRLAHALRERGVGPDVLVGICMERSVEMVVAILGVLKSGGAYVPLDPHYPVERLAFMIETAQTPVLLTQEHLLSTLPGLPAQEAFLVCLDRDWPSLAQQPAIPIEVPVTAANLAYVMFTSGSTGQPKGVMIPHSAICNHMLWMQHDLPLYESDRVLQRTPFSFDASVWEFYAPLLAGACLVMARPDLHADSEMLVEEIQRHKISVMQLVPSLLQLVLSVAREQFTRCRSLRRVLCGGEALSGKLVQQFFACLDAELYNLYGPTETTIDATYWRCMPDDGRDYSPIGRPIANTQLYVLDGHLQPVPIGVPGELFIGGAGLARGYLNRPDLTEERFLLNPFAAAGDVRLYRTGDLVRYTPDGALEFLGRIDQQVKLRGYRVELGEIEAVLARHPDVLSAGVMLRDENGGQQLVAYVSQQPEPRGGLPDPGQAGPEQVAKWQEVYDEIIYAPAENGDGSGNDGSFNTVGWNSSFTADPIPAAEMQEWLDETVSRIARWRPQHVLEIGCGTGMLLFRLAPDCQSYTATDFSQRAIDYVQQYLAILNGNAGRLHLLQQEADRFEGIEARAFTTVILNSVVQYFPSMDYLLRVLEGAVAAVKPGGIVFVGDVRSLPLLPALHAAVELARAPDDLGVAELQQLVQQRTAHEEELVVDPDFFAALKQRLPRVSHVEIQPKLGRCDNELTRYRYDVLLHVEGSFLQPHIPSLHWQQEKLSPTLVKQLLQDTKPERLCILEVPNALLSADLAVLALLHEAETTMNVKQLREIHANAERSGISPFDLAHLAAESGYRAAFRLTTPGNFGQYDVRLRRADVDGDVDDEPFVAVDVETPRPWTEYANNPLQATAAHRLVSDLRKYLQGQLPDYMIPAAFVLVDHLPVTPNGKLNRDALPRSSQQRPTATSVYLEPKTVVQKKLATIWSEVLGIQQIGVDDNFFDLGGHSLLAAQVTSRVRSAFQIDLPLRHIFLTPRLADLALVIEEILIEEIESSTALA